VCVIQRWIFCVVSAVTVSSFLSSPLQADALYTVTNLGPASPSPAYQLVGQSPNDPNGNYLTLLSSSQQAAFQAGSFDGFAHPANTASVSNPDAYGLVDSNGYVTGLNWVTGNNVGELAGFAQISDGGGPYAQLVIYTSDPHVISNPRAAGLESSGYVGFGAGPMSDYNFQSAVVAGVNDHASLVFNYSLPGSGGPNRPAAVFTAYLNSGTIGTLGGASAFATALNNSNDVVGWSQTASGAQHAFLYASGTMQDLNLLIPATSGITLVTAAGIDAAGDIVAYGTNASGQMNEYYLAPAEVPAPEPGMLAVMSVMIVALAVHTAHRRACAR
jgi:probable HAF family extracellular repeat protein